MLCRSNINYTFFSPPDIFIWEIKKKKIQSPNLFNPTFDLALDYLLEKKIFFYSSRLLNHHFISCLHFNFALRKMSTPIPLASYFLVHS